MYPGGGVIFRSDTTSNRRQTTDDRKGQRRTPHSKPPQESPNPTSVLSKSPLRKRKPQQGNKEQEKESREIYLCYIIIDTCTRKSRSFCEVNRDTTCSNATSYSSSSEKSCCARAQSRNDAYMVELCMCASCKLRNALDLTII